MKTQAVMYPTKQLSEHILDDTDLAGPLCFCLLLGACLLLSGKVHFGYIYGKTVDRKRDRIRDRKDKKRYRSILWGREKKGEEIEAEEGSSSRLLGR